MRKIGIISLVVAVVLLSVFFARFFRNYLSDPAAYMIRSRVTSIGASSQVAGDRLQRAALVAKFYEDTNYAPAWSSEKGLQAKTRIFLEILRESDRRGLRPEDYHLETIESLVAESEAARGTSSLESRVDLELLLTDAFFLFGGHLYGGRVNPGAIYPDWYNLPPREGSDEGIFAALRSGNLEKALRGLEPPDPRYQKLQEGMEDYRRIASRGGWHTIPAGEKLRAGERDWRIVPLRRRLALSGDLERASSDDSNLFDVELERAVRRFQARHGLYVDGVLGAATVEELNVPVEKRIRQITLNMERLRWLPRQLGDRYIFVNVAGFHLDVVEDGGPVMNMRIIVGKDEEEQRTFIFAGKMTYLEINPYWNVPESIATNELIPRAKKNPRYLASQGIRILDGWREDSREIRPEDIRWDTVDPEAFRYRFRQDPGPKNPLGRIKFMFPNEFSVYLHDTPMRQLFERTKRDFSHGCIRIERPIDLAVYLLRDYSDWSRDDILKAQNSRQRQVVTLPEPVPVYIYYLTAWADHGGVLHFRRDVYHGDKMLEQALDSRKSRLARVP